MYMKLAPNLLKHWIIPIQIGAITTEGTRNTQERLNFIRSSNENKKIEKYGSPEFEQLLKDIVGQISDLIETIGDVNLGTKIKPIRQGDIQQLRDKEREGD
ncbi:MAG: hypothetical protein EZS28_002626 [Streblomastix strix]|uniref:Uncharacterized protein n=1 Tax=Streblomastix strix TaxID=222440 RepID=A0A5J4X5P5_9EUKA|nr:MAG: hypothetical protein EZS28_002626 [Streblomastix strix]